MKEPHKRNENGFWGSWDIYVFKDQKSSVRSAAYADGVIRTRAILNVDAY